MSVQILRRRTLHGCLFALVLFSPVAASAAPGTWTAVSSLNVARRDATGGFVGGRLYVVGGFAFGSPMTSLERYVPPWAVEAANPAPTARRGAGAAVLDGKLYVVSGYTVSEGSGVKTTEAWQPAPFGGGGSWTSLRNTGQARVYPAVGGAHGRVWALGGLVGGVATAGVEMYEVSANQWNAAGSQLLTARGGAGVAALNGLFYIVGGRDASGGYLASMEAFDPVANLSAPKASMPTPRWRLGVMVMDGRLYALGGENGSGLLAVVEAYDPALDAWISAEPLPSARSSAVAAGDDSLGLVAGGFDGGSELSETLRFFERAPLFDPIDHQTVTEGQTLSFPVLATDPDGDEIAYSPVALPAGATFDSGLGEFEWTPGSGAAGDHSAVLRAGDGLLADTLTVAITVLTAGGVPDSPAPSFAIRGVSPNPVAGVASIALGLPHAGAYRLDVFGIDGRLEATLLDGSVEAGDRTVRWNLRDGSGRRVPAGVYLLGLTHGRETITRRIVVVR